MRLTARRALVAPALLGLVLTIPLLGARDLWAPDEPRYAQVAQETLDGHWWHPHLNGAPYRDKPPLYFWAQAATAVLLSNERRVDEWSARLPAALASIVTLALCADLARRLVAAGDPSASAPRAAAVAGIALATSGLWAWSARRVGLDVPLTAATVACCWSAWRARELALADRTASVALAATAGVAAALGVMTKGPVILLFAVAFAAPAWRGRGPDGRRPSPLRLAAAAAAGLALVLAAWLVPAATLGGYDALSIAREHVVDRAAEGRHHVRPPWYYLVNLPLGLLPWTPLAVPAVLAAWRRRREPAVAAVLSWTLVPLAVLTLVVEKREVYLLPSHPAWAVLVGAWVAAPGRDLAARSLARWTLVGLALLSASLVAAGLVGHREIPDVPGLRAGLVVAGALSLAAAALGLLVERRAPDALRSACTIGGCFAVLLLSVFAVLPRLDPVKSAREAGESIRALPPGEVASFPILRGAYVYYGRRPLVHVADGETLREWILERPAGASVLTWARHADSLPELPGWAREVRHEGPVGHRSVLLLRFRREAEAEEGASSGTEGNERPIASVGEERAAPPGAPAGSGRDE